MKHRKAYHYLMEQINAAGSKKMDGNYPKMMEEIYRCERAHVETVIWNRFHQGMPAWRGFYQICGCMTDSQR